MPKRPDVGVIAEQVIERLKPIEDQVTEDQRIADELGRLRDAVMDLERAIGSRFSGEPVPPAQPTERAPRQRAAKRSRAAARPSAAKRATAPHGQNQAKILAALKGSEPMTASEIAEAHGHLGQHRQYDPDEDGQDRRADHGRAPATGSGLDHAAQLARRPGREPRHRPRPRVGAAAHLPRQRGARTGRGLGHARPTARHAPRRRPPRPVDFQTWRTLAHDGTVNRAGVVELTSAMVSRAASTQRAIGNWLRSCACRASPVDGVCTLPEQPKSRNEAVA